MKSLIAFSRAVLEDLGDRCGISTSRDSKTVADRCEHEGFEFLTLTLPAFGKDFQASLDEGCVAHGRFPAFARNGGLPRFLGGFLELVFDRNSGVLLDDPSIEAIRSIHQFTLMFGKTLLPCSDARTRAAFDGFVRCEQDLHDAAEVPASYLEAFDRIGGLLFRELFVALDLKVWKDELLPKHGPGATAEKHTSNGKYMQTEWTSRLDKYFPVMESIYPNAGWYNQLQADVQILEPGAERPVRVISVPKTHKTPRIIAVEPTCMQYTQQSLLEVIREGVERDNLLNRLIGFSDQSPNRDLARLGSLTGTLATLDLQEASDRVSWWLVSRLLRRHAELLGAVDACRSRTADVPGHGVIPLAKFASMGSALTFPIEAMVFITVVLAGIEHAYSTRLTRGAIHSLLGQVRVYGDDIIVPTDTMHSVVAHLEAFGLKVNASKSFGTGRFRESCGGDYYAGHRITPVRVRRALPITRKDVPELVSTVSLRNQLFDAGFEKAVAWLDRRIRRVLPVYPEIPRTSSALGRWTHGPVKADVMCPDTQRPMVRAYVVEDVTPRDFLGGHGALMKWFLKRSDTPFENADHLERSGRAQQSRIKLSRTPSFDWEWAPN